MKVILLENLGKKGSSTRSMFEAAEKKEKGATGRPPHREPRTVENGWGMHLVLWDPDPPGQLYDYRFIKNNNPLTGSNTPLGRRPGEL